MDPVRSGSRGHAPPPIGHRVPAIRSWILLSCLAATLPSPHSLTAPNASARPAVPERKEAGREGVAATFVDMSPRELAKEVHELKRLQPAESQNALPEILERVGKTVAAILDNFPNTTCTERVSYEVEMPTRRSSHQYVAKFNYLALAEPGAGKTELQEYRTDSKGKQISMHSMGSGFITTGFVSMFEHFHRDLQPDSRFRYLGREVMKGRDTYVVSFAQRPERARHVESVEVPNENGTVFVQGVAWIDPVRYGILRMRTDILKEIGIFDLRRETTDVEYSEVTFARGGKTLWLPQEVKVMGQMGQYTFYNLHRYSDYRLFKVEAAQRPTGD